jgi:hypothetical protein
MTKLTDAQKQQIDDLIAYTILPALQEDICIPDMSDMEQEEELPATYDETYSERVDILTNEALVYLRNNLH